MALADKLLSHVAVSKQGVNEETWPPRSDCFGDWSVKIRAVSLLTPTFIRMASTLRELQCGRVANGERQVSMAVLIVQHVREAAVASPEERLSMDMVAQANALSAAVPTRIEIS